MREQKIPWILLMGAAWLLGPVIFLFAAGSRGTAGFPLDDSWIHQTYARSLAQGQGWSYAGGSASAGSTSPAWTLLQVPGYWTGLSPIAWSNPLGTVLLLCNAFFLARWARTERPEGTVFVFLFALWEWHLVWASVSGMETILYCAWVTLMLMIISVYLGSPKSSVLGAPLGMGLLLGAGIWIRPEAVLFSTIALLILLVSNSRCGWKPSIAILAGSGFSLATYFGFELALHGRLWPNTFFAKPAEYQALTADGLLFRLIQTWIPILAGPLSILLVFILVYVFDKIRNRTWISLWPLAWVAAHMVVFAVQLPVTYQHGRYLIPVLPILLGYGVLGFLRTAAWAERIRVIRIARSVLWISAVLILILFLGIGAGQYSQDVHIIKTEMIESSIWIRDHTPQQAIIAAHDIGALGYFGERPILDLGGLTDLSALELLSGRQSLSVYLAERNAEYLVTFPGFYRSELADCIPIWTSQSDIRVKLAGGNMSVYQWPASCGQTGGGA